MLYYNTLCGWQGYNSIQINIKIKHILKVFCFIIFLNQFILPQFCSNSIKLIYKYIGQKDRNKKRHYL